MKEETYRFKHLGTCLYHSADETVITGLRLPRTIPAQIATSQES